MVKQGQLCDGRHTTLRACACVREKHNENRDSTTAISAHTLQPGLTSRSCTKASCIRRVRVCAKLLRDCDALGNLLCAHAASCVTCDTCGLQSAKHEFYDQAWC
jgi:hypothetical protein